MSEFFDVAGRFAEVEKELLALPDDAFLRSMFCTDKTPHKTNVGTQFRHEMGIELTEVVYIGAPRRGDLDDRERTTQAGSARCRADVGSDLGFDVATHAKLVRNATRSRSQAPLHPS